MFQPLGANVKGTSVSSLARAALSAWKVYRSYVVGVDIEIINADVVKI